MKKVFKYFTVDKLFVLSAFFLVSFFLTFNVISSPSLVIGDSLYWNDATIIDMLGPTIMRETFLGDVALLSNFKTGFLFPVTLGFSSLGIPITVLYPFSFYLLSMFSFYSLSTEFLKSKLIAVSLAIMYIINPVTPYYFTSLFTAFVVVFLPLTLKFFAKSLRRLDKPLTPPYLSKNFLLAGLFLSLSVSAHEQFFLSGSLIGAAIVGGFIITLFKKHKQNQHFARFLIVNLVMFIFVFIIINLPLLISVINVNRAPLSVYFTGRFDDFLANVRYSYATTNPITLLRFGGDSGVGLNQVSWYDLNTPLNLLGYTIFAIINTSLLFVFKKNSVKKDKYFFYTVISLFVGTFTLLIFMSLLPSNKYLSEALFSFVIQTWESPTKLRIVLLLSALTLTIVTFTKLEKWSKNKNRKFIHGPIVLLVLLLFFSYNSPWLLEYAGYTPMQQVSDNLEWGALFEESYANISNLIVKEFDDTRGVIIPYTHKAELYVPPNFRVFQLVSGVNEQMLKLTGASTNYWSKILGFISAKYVILNKDYDKNELLIFPKTLVNNFSQIYTEIEVDSGLDLVDQIGNFSIYKNQNTLPKVYASNNYVIYDDASTLKYTFPLINFSDLPVFIESPSLSNQLNVPNYLQEGEYMVYAITNPNEEISNRTLTITSSNTTRILNLEKNSLLDSLSLFSTSCNLKAGEILEIADPSSYLEVTTIDELTLSSNSFSLGFHDSFTLDLKISDVTWGESDYLGPRIILNSDNSSSYMIIFHKNGVVELVSNHGDELYSSFEAKYSGVDFSTEDPVDVTVTRIFDEIQIQLNGDNLLSFSIEPDTFELLLSSEHSTTRFTEIQYEKRDVVKIFAIRQVDLHPQMTLKESGPNKSVLTVFNGTSDYVVVVQYLNTPLRHLTTSLNNKPIRVNEFFSGWLITDSDFVFAEEEPTFVIETEQIAITLTFLSIGFSYSLLFYGFGPPSAKKSLLSILRRFLKQVKSVYCLVRKKAEEN